MTLIHSRLFAAALLAAVGALGARADLAVEFDFDSVPAGSAASAFDTANFSFHNAVFAARQDADGIDIPGSERWTVDFATDWSSPLTVDNPFTFGFGDAPSGTNALNATFGPVFIRFDQAYNLTSFATVLDNSTFGDLGSSHIWFLSANSIVGQLAFDATVPGASLTMAGVNNVTGIVFQGGGFYDNVALSAHPVPEPATWGALGAAACAGLILSRRFRRRS